MKRAFSPGRGRWLSTPCALSTILLFALFGNPSLLSGQSHPAHPAPDPRHHRLIVLTDIGAEVDDTESMVRLVLYSDDIDIQGLIATTSTWKRTSVSPNLIVGVLNAYARVYGNLLKHDPTYPAPARLLALVKHGRPEYGMTGVGRGKDSEGSAWIIRTVEEKDDRPLWIAVWGGVNTLAQALYTMRATLPADEVDRLVSRLRVYTISDQDDSGAWIRKNFPGLFYIVSPGGNYSAATWTGINAFIPGIDNTTISNKWLAEHIQQGHGPLGAIYPDVAYGMEGDTPSWLALIPNGLGNPEHPDWGGWGGRYELYRPDPPASTPNYGGIPIETETRPVWTNAVDDFTPVVPGEYGRATHLSDKSFHDFKATLWRWRDDFQNDFAARMEWTTKSFQHANHPPQPVLDVPAEFSVHSGEEFHLDAHATDPDGDSLSFLWFQYPEAGSCKQRIPFSLAENMAHITLIAPKVNKPETAHFILRVTDKGTPALSRYKRVIVTITP